MNIPLPSSSPPYALSSQCVVLALNLERLKPLLARGWIAFGGRRSGGGRPWTDDYINLLAPLWARLWPKSTNLDESMHTCCQTGTAK